ncbi:MAG: pyruvate:ferredoxin (flavodoxin) oxidoreductase [Acidobacteriota bacterium]|nr:pyruvate:ferredoxin (flavodoxin) oxidoreductase [Acidobacteriota bacterium]
MHRPMITIDGNEAAARIAHKVNEVIAIYPITPSSGMGELADEFSARGQTNIWGTIPHVMEMQSEGGASGAVHGALQTGALTTTFTASQGLLLMIPNMFKIAGELTSTVFHVSARSVATHALSIFGDHSDVMAARTTGFALLASGSVQEVQDFALIATAATLEARVPFVHFFDGFRTSHEVNKITALGDDEIQAMIPEDKVIAHRRRGLDPDRPCVRGTAQNPDVFFQAREAVNPFYQACPGIVQKTMDRFAEVTGRSYHLFDYYGAPDAERVIILMGSGAQAAEETAESLASSGEKVGVVAVRLYRPFASSALLAALPATTRIIATLDRTKEPGAVGEPLYQDVATTILEAAGRGELPFETQPLVIGGRYGLSSKEFTPQMIKGVFDEMSAERPKNHFTVGIVDDVTHNSIEVDEAFEIPRGKMVQALFYGLGSDGTVGANKNSVKIIGEGTDNFAQGYFVYDSKKAGAVTVSHLRFGSEPIRSTYLLEKADFIGCHQWVFLERFDLLDKARKGATFLLNSPYSPEETWSHLQRIHQKRILDKQLKVYVIDAYRVAEEAGMGARINTIMQTCFFAISGVLPRGQAIAKIKDAIRKTYGKKGEAIVDKNFRAVDMALANMHEMKIPGEVTSQLEMPPVVPDHAPEFVRKVTAEIIAGRGDRLPVSAMPVDGTFPAGTSRYEKRNIALAIPVWDPDVCTQCGKCSLICPHAAIRQKIYDPALLEKAPATFKAADYRGKDFEGVRFTIQVAPEDCTGCALCVHVCPAKNRAEPRLKAINMEPQPPLREQEAANFEFFLGLPEVDRRAVKANTVKGSQLLQPLFEYSGACSGCGETPYVKLLSQLFGDRAIIANATGCSSIYGGNLPTTPWTVNRDGRGPAWSNSLFEDNAEFGLGFRLTLDKQNEFARELVRRLASEIGTDLADAILEADQSSEAGIVAQRERVEAMTARLRRLDSDLARRLLSVAHALMHRSIWIVGGDGWAYDIGYGGLDHVLASGRDVNVLVLDTEVYSNTGGQMSKATPLGAIAKFAAAGKPMGKKDLGMMGIAYSNVYVAQVAMGANDTQTVKAFLEAESYAGPSLILAYSHCIAHGINMGTATDSHKRAVKSGHWPLYRFDPRRTQQGLNPLQLDSRKPTMPIAEYMGAESRFKMLQKIDPERSRRLTMSAQKEVEQRWARYEYLAGREFESVKVEK